MVLTRERSADQRRGRRRARAAAGRPHNLSRTSAASAAIGARSSEDSEGRLGVAAENTRGRPFGELHP
jgi:hypothetical protein